MVVGLADDSRDEGSCLPAADARGWQRIAHDELRHPPLIASIRNLMALSGDRLLAYDPVWHAASGASRDDAADERAVALVLRRGGGNAGYAPFCRGPCWLPFAIDFRVFIGTRARRPNSRSSPLESREKKRYR